MSSPDPERSSAIRALIDDQLKRRLDERLSRIKGTDKTADERRAQAASRLDRNAMLAAAAEVADQIQLATHIVKAIHPDPKVNKSTNLRVDPAALALLEEVGSHLLGDNYEIDATGNGAHNAKVFEAYALLRTTFDGTSLLDLLRRGDIDALAAIGEHAGAAESRGHKFLAMDAPRSARTASDTRAKQVYWLTGSDPHDDRQFQLLAPLYPTSLVHRVYETLQDDRFSDEAKEARAARKAGDHHDRPVHEYSNLAIQKLGGTKPQNISQLNSERRGDNALLASLPPVWKSSEFKPILHSSSMFKAFGQRKSVWQQARALRNFLASDPSPTVDTRRRRADWVDNLIDELIQFTAGMQRLPTGWTQADGCQLPLAHRQWLDPEGAEPGSDDPSQQVADDFANWLNAQLRPPLPVGDPEFGVWRKLTREALKVLDREAA